MKTYIRYISAIVLIFVSSFPNFVRAQENQIAAPYSPKEGDRWEFRGEEKDRISSSSNALVGQFAAMYKKGELVFVSIFDGTESDATPGIATQLKRLFSFAQDERQYLRFPLRTGDKWQVSYKRVLPGTTRTLTTAEETRVIGFKNVDVAAGHFTVAELKREGQVSGSSVPTETIILYSPITGCVVHYYYDSYVGGKGAKSTVELTKVTPAK